MFVGFYVDILIIKKGIESMDMGKTVLAQMTLISFCKLRGYTDMKFIGIDCVSSEDQNGRTRKLTVNFTGEVCDVSTGEVIGE